MNVRVAAGVVHDGSSGLGDAASELDRARGVLMPYADMNIGPLRFVHTEAVQRMCGAMSVGSVAARELRDGADRAARMMGDTDGNGAAAILALTPAAPSDH